MTAEPQEGAGAPGRPSGDDIVALVLGAADGDPCAWEQLVTCFSELVTSIMVAHRLNEVESAQVRTAVWRRLSRNLGRIRQPERVGTWLGAVTRDECVRVRAGAGTAPPPSSAA